MWRKQQNCVRIVAGENPLSLATPLETGVSNWSSFSVGSLDSAENAGGASEDSVWSNSSTLVLDLRRLLRCAARLVRLQWRRVDRAQGQSWRDLELAGTNENEVTVSGLAAEAWFALRLWTVTESARHHATVYAATTARSGERPRRPAAFPVEAPPAAAEAETERVLTLVSVAFAALAAAATAALIVVLLAKRSALPGCGAGGTGSDADEQHRSHSASTEKSLCADQQNLRNCQHDYKHDKLSPESDIYEISPYATFAVGAEGTGATPAAGAGAATLDHTLQFRTFGHRDNDAPPHRAHPPCRKHPQRHRDQRTPSEKHRSDCELQHLTRYEKARRHCAAPSYCVPMPHTGGGVSSSGGGAFSEVYAGDSSAESGPGSLSPRAPHHSDHS